MRPNLFACVGMALAALSASAASAQTAYKAEDIVKHFDCCAPDRRNARLVCRYGGRVQQKGDRQKRPIFDLVLRCST